MAGKAWTAGALCTQEPAVALAAGAAEAAGVAAGSWTCASAAVAMTAKSNAEATTCVRLIHEPYDEVRCASRLRHAHPR